MVGPRTLSGGPGLVVLGACLGGLFFGTGVAGASETLRGIHVAIHRVKPGETLSSIVATYRTTRGTLESLNSNVDLENLKVGDRVKILSRPGVFHRMQPGLTISDITDAYRVSQADLLRANGIAKARNVQAGGELFIPDAGPISSGQLKKMRRKATARVKASTRSKVIFGRPLSGRMIISDRFGYRFHPITRRKQRHSGVDLIAPWGTPILASRAGVVEFAGWKGGYGKLVIIKHEKGYSTYYGHATEVLVKAGDVVEQGQAVARLGATGDVTAPHLHFEVRRWGSPHDPLRYVR